MTAEQVKARVSPLSFYKVELPSMPVPRRDRGWVDGGLCPFHQDQHRGNFRINLDSGAYTCFSCGARGGDIVSFVQCSYALSFRDALQKIASDWGIPR
jgi:DNA primase